MVWAISMTRPGTGLPQMGTAQTFPSWTAAAGIGLGTSALTLATQKSFEGDATNLQRYAMNLDKNGQGALLPQPFATVTDAGTVLSLSYRQRKGMIDVVLIPQYSTDQINWAPVPAANIQPMPDDDANTARFLASMTMPPGQLLFMRVIAQVNNSAIVQWPLADGGNGHYYQVVIVWGMRDSASAQSYAATLGGYPATLTSAAENTFVFALTNAPQFWTSGSPRGTTGPMIGVNTGIIGAPVFAPTWFNNEGFLSAGYTNWDSAAVVLGRRGGGRGGISGFNTVQFFSASGHPAATWAALSTSAFSLVIEYDTKPAGN